MWYIRQASKDTPEFADSAMELLQSTSRNLIWVTAAVYLLWHLAVTMLWSEMFILKPNFRRLDSGRKL